MRTDPIVHNMVVCTPCARATRGRSSGLPPVWSKAAPYRSYAVTDPRGVLSEFGLELPEGAAAMNALVDLAIVETNASYAGSSPPIR